MSARRSYRRDAQRYTRNAMRAFPELFAPELPVRHAYAALTSVQPNNRARRIIGAL